MGCEGCLFTVQQMRRDLDTARKKAKEYAKQHNTQVTLYMDGPKWTFCTLERATSEGIPIGEVLSQY